MPRIDPIARFWFLRPAVLAPLFALIYALWLIGYAGHPLVLATLSVNQSPPELLPYTYSEEGYDGSTVYLLARYGWEAAPYLDVPAYRAQRILLPALGRLVALGHTDALPFVLLAINLVALGLGTFCLEVLLADYGVSIWFAAGYAFSLGVWGAARLTTTETLAYGLVTAGLLAFRRERWGWAAVIFALAGLAKETTFLFPLALGVLALLERRWRQALAMLITLGPFILLQAVLHERLGAFGVGSGGALATPFEIIPLAGFLRILFEGGAAVFLSIGLIVLIFAVLPTLWSLWAVSRDLYRSWQRRRHPTMSHETGFDWLSLLLFANAALMLFVPFSTYREPLGILRFIVGLQIALILYAASRRYQRILVYSTLWFITSFLVIYSDVIIIGAHR